MTTTGWQFRDVFNGSDLVPQMKGPTGPWQPFNPDAMASERALRTGRNLLTQDTWWTGADGITKLIDDLEDDHRRFICRMLIDKASLSHLQVRRNEIISLHWDYVRWCDEHDGGAYEDEPTAREIFNIVRREQDRGEHLVRVRTSRLFIRMSQGLGWFHPGVMPQ